MNRQEAMQCALGYAWGREDASGQVTPSPACISGSFAFAEAFAAGWEAYNTGQRFYMVPVRAAYERWTETRGASIFPADDPCRPAPLAGAEHTHPANPQVSHTGRLEDCSRGQS